MSEVVLDEGGIELLWRVHFGFFDPVVAGNDTDGDGITDADEEKNWTDPRNKNEPDLKKSPEQRRQDVIEAMRSPEPIQAGKPATISEELALEYTANVGIRTRIAMSQAAAHARVEAWSKRTGNKRNHFRGGVVTDVEGDEPVVQYDNGIISNTSANVMPLWPGQSVQSDVMGYGLIGNPLAGYTMTRQICGMWEKHVPLDTHNELFGRVAWGDDARPGPDSSHATAVAGIIGASGTAGSTTIPNGLTFVHADFRGVAYQCEVRAYDLDLNYTELSALNPPPGGTGENLLKRMRASNHSYGPNYGWKGVDVNGIRLWDGSIEVLFPTAPNYVPEDYRFGLYNEDAQQADSTAYALPYRLLVRAAGNETGEGSMDGRFLSISINGGLFTNWWYSSFLGTGPNRSPVYVNSVLGLWVYANAVNPIMSGGVLIGGTVADP